jgi:hypothetical protein
MHYNSIIENTGEGVCCENGGCFLSSPVSCLLKKLQLINKKTEDNYLLIRPQNEVFFIIIQK